MIEIGIPGMDKFLGGRIKTGSNIIFIGPPMSGKEVILNQIMYHATVKNDNAVITVNTYEPGNRILEWFNENKLVLPESRIGIVDCITKMIGREADDVETIKKVSSPVDLTDIGVKISQFFEIFSFRENVRKTQLYINSLSTLLMYSNLKTVFRFLYVFTGRIKAAGGLGVYVLESGIHDVQVVETLSQLFDGVIEVKSEDDKNFIRTIGVSVKPSPWLEYEINGAEVKIQGG